MITGRLYDIKNYRDFYNSLHIMESMEDEKFDLIYMELPTYNKKTQFMFHKTPFFENEKHPDVVNDIYSFDADFLTKCIENAYRLLPYNGILVLNVPKTTTISLDYYLILDQFFPSIKDVVLYRENTLFPGKISTIYFCSKDEYFRAPEKLLFPINRYDNRDCLGFYRLIPATVSKKELSYNYTWNGINPAPEFAWKHPKEELIRLAHEKKLHIEQDKVYIKIYRDDELTDLDFESHFFWKVDSSLENKSNSPYYCNSPEVLEKIFSLYCNANDQVFCPFDYCNMFPLIADKEHLMWTSVKIHAYNEFEKFSSSDLFNRQYYVYRTLPPLENKIEYRKNIIHGTGDIQDLTFELETLAKSIKTVKDVLRIDDSQEPYPFGYMDISEDALVEKFHSFISSSITAEMLDGVSEIAEKEHAAYWNKLEDKCQKYIKTALILSRNINPADIDGAPILVELFKTFESELYTKLFLSYAIKLKQSNTSMQIKYKDQRYHRETKEFWDYLNSYIAESKELHLSIGRMNNILERTLTKNSKKTIYTDFQKYLHSILKPAFFENNFTTNISKLINIRNEGIHKEFTSKEKLEECTNVIKEKLNHLLCNLSVLPDKNLTQHTSNKQDITAKTRL